VSIRTYIAAAAVALVPVFASAATVDINFQSFGAGKNSADIAGAITERNAFIGSTPVVVNEAFDGFTACDNTNSGSCDVSPATSVGQFTGITPSITTGGSQVDPKGKIVIRSDTPNAFNRFDVEGTDGNWLDSNDMNGINWDIPGSSSLSSNITKIAFFLTDVDDVGNLNFSITASGDVTSYNVSNAPTSGRPDGELLLVTMLFSEAVSDLNIQMISGTNDGYGIDGITVAAVPLPAGGVLLLTALGGVAALRRKRKAA